MARTYPQELRDRVLAAYDRGMKTKQIADVFMVCRAWARGVKQRRRETGQTTAMPRGGATVIKIDPQHLRELVDQHPDATAAELHALLGVECSVSAVDQALRRHGLTFKKRRRSRPSRTAPTSSSSVTTGAISNPRSTQAD